MGQLPNLLEFQFPYCTMGYYFIELLYKGTHENPNTQELSKQSYYQQLPFISKKTMVQEG